MESTAPRLYMGRWRDYHDFTRWMISTRRRAGLSQERLGELVGLSKVSIRKIELGQTRAPKYETVSNIIEALEKSNGHSTEDQPYLGKVSPDRRGERPAEVSLMPVYRWGARGDPRTDDSRPLPESREYPAGGAPLVGPHGFGVIVAGDALVGYGIEDRDVAWCNPDERPNANMPVVVIRDGLEVRVDGTGKETSGFSNGDVIGPVVWITPSGYPPMRPHA